LRVFIDRLCRPLPVRNNGVMIVHAFCLTRARNTRSRTRARIFSSATCCAPRAERSVWMQPCVTTIIERVPVWVVWVRYSATRARQAQHQHGKGTCRAALGATRSMGRGFLVWVHRIECGEYRVLGSCVHCCGAVSTRSPPVGTWLHCIVAVSTQSAPVCTWLPLACTASVW
jgi:hypothetical protein